MFQIELKRIYSVTNEVSKSLHAWKFKLDLITVWIDTVVKLGLYAKVKIVKIRPIMTQLMIFFSLLTYMC